MTPLGKIHVENICPIIIVFYIYISDACSFKDTFISGEGSLMRACICFQRRYNGSQGYILNILPQNLLVSFFFTKHVLAKHHGGIHDYSNNSNICFFHIKILQLES